MSFLLAKSNIHDRVTREVGKSEIGRKLRSRSEKSDFGRKNLGAVGKIVNEKVRSWLKQKKYDISAVFYFSDGHCFCLKLLLSI